MELPLPLTLALQKGIDSYIQSDPFVLKQMAPLRNRVIRFEITAPRLVLTLGFVETGVVVMRNFDGEPDSTISGALQPLLDIRKDNAPLYRRDVSIDGDMGVALEFKKFVAGLDIDLEGLIAPWTGGTIAHQITRFGSEFNRWIGRTASSFEQNVSEYLTEEVEWVAPDGEISRFINSVDELRAATDRLDARIANLEKGDLGD